MKTTLMALIGCALLAGCASNVKDGDASTGAKKLNSNIVCKKGASTGSHLRRKSCRTKQQIQAERDAAQKELRRINNPNNARKG